MLHPASQVLVRRVHLQQQQLGLEQYRTCRRLVRTHAAGVLAQKHVCLCLHACIEMQMQGLALMPQVYIVCSCVCAQAAADVLAMASLEVDLSGINEGEVSSKRRRSSSSSSSSRRGPTSSCSGGCSAAVAAGRVLVAAAGDAWQQKQQQQGTRQWAKSACTQLG
mgnify:CR=1 FL=1